MQARYRNGLGNGYRSNPMGIRGAASASRISPEGSMRGHRVYSPDHRNYNRGGYARAGHSKQFQQPQHYPSDIFIEAGRLAAEYLVSKGRLPPEALSVKWQNNGLKSQVGDSHGFRPPKLESTKISADGQSSMGLRNSVKVKRSAGSFKNYETGVNMEMGGSGSSAERSRASPGMEANDDAPAGHHDEKPVGKDGNGGIHNSSSCEITQERDTAHLESGLKTCNSMEHDGAKASSPVDEKDLMSDAYGENMKISDDANKLQEDMAKEEMDDDTDLEQRQEEEVTASAGEESLASEENDGLLKPSKFENFGTNTQSTLTTRGPKGESEPMNEDKNIPEKELSQGSGVHIVDVYDNASGNASSHQNGELKSLESESFSEALCKEQEPDEGLSGYGSSNAMFTQRGGKRVMNDDIDFRDSFKKLREWVPVMDAQSDGCLPPPSSMDNQPTLHEQEISESSHATVSPEQKTLDISLFPKGHAASTDFLQEKQLFPGSFKTCDLNLTRTCDASESHDADSVLILPSVTEAGKEVSNIAVDLSMTNNFNPSKRNRKPVISEDIEVIDLENDYAQAGNSFSNPEKREDTVYTDLDGFPNNVHNANQIAVGQDGYGLMISELLGNGSPSCSSVPTDLNSLQNDIGLPSGEGILGDDDSIYMSLGEIPIGFLRAWEQPTQDYGKPF